ncbi:MAG: TonB family protein [Bacteroidales bacterium]|nr:TonB family protein [Bacteroidales bacterium]
MKKIISIIAAVLVAQAAFAQVCAFRVDGEKITFEGKTIDIHEAGTILEKAQTDFQDIFVYVSFDTPIGLVNDLQSIIQGSCTSGVVFLNPRRNKDFPRSYGPKMAYHGNFIEFDLLKKAKTATFFNDNDNHSDFFLRGAAPDDYAYNITRIKMYLRTPHDKANAVTEWTNNFDCVVFDLSYQTTIGELYNLDHDLNLSDVPYINVVYHTEETPLSPERWFRVMDSGLEEYEFRTVTSGQEGVQAIYNGKDIKNFSDTFNAYSSITDLKGKEARPGKGRAVVQFEITPLGTVKNVQIVRPSNLPGLDKVILDNISHLDLWAPQLVKGQPVNVKVSCPIYGEISQW